MCHERTMQTFGEIKLMPLALIVFRMRTFMNIPSVYN